MVNGPSSITDNSEGAVRVLVFGGSGFLGRSICRLGRRAGYAITSLSRSGKPAVREPWLEGISWRAVRFEGDWRSWDLRSGWDTIIWPIGLTYLRKISFEQMAGQIKKHLDTDRIVWIDRRAARTLESRVESISDWPSIEQILVEVGAVYNKVCPISVLRAGLFSGLNASGDSSIFSDSLVAMAAIRLAVESDVPGTVSGAQLEEWGSAAMIQGNLD